MALQFGSIIAIQRFFRKPQVPHDYVSFIGGVQLRYSFGRINTSGTFQRELHPRLGITTRGHAWTCGMELTLPGLRAEPTADAGKSTGDNPTSRLSEQVKGTAC